MSTKTDLPTESQDGSPYIRTFAKDFAAMSGKKQEPTLVKSPQEKEQSPVQEKIISSPPAPIPTDDRKAILARLKEKAQAAAYAESVPPPTIIEESKVLPAELNQSFISEPPIPLPPPEEIPEPLPIPPVVPIITPEKNQLPAQQLHTYSTDFADHIEKTHASKFSVLAAENDAVRKPSPRPRKKTKMLPIFVGFAFLILGTGALITAYLYMNSSKYVSGALVVPSLVASDAKITLSGTGTTLLQAFAHQADQPLPDNNILLTYINQSTTTPQGVVEQPASGGAFITTLNLPAPDILFRNIDPVSTVGIVHAGKETRAFFILRVTSYERTFAGMLEWEGDMPQNLALLYPQSTTTTASQFVDEVVSNHDTRALKDGAGHTVMLYGYADKQTLIIARNEDAFTLLLSRLTPKNK